jgi:hypothetical protein
MSGFQDSISAGFDQMIDTYRLYRDKQTREQRMDANRKALNATQFTRKELEEMLVLALEKLTAS